MIQRCPGQDDRKITIEIMDCLKCGYPVELFSDEIQTLCPRCKNKVYKVKMPSCIDWCRSARECIGRKKWDSIKKGE